MSHLLSFTVDSDPQKVRLAITGEIDLATVDLLVDAIDGAALTSAPTVELDMASVTFLDSTGISTLVKAHRALHRQRRRLTVTRAPAHVMLVMRMTGVDTLLGATPAAPGIPGVVPPTALQNAVALLTTAMHVGDTVELKSLIQEFRDKDDSDELMLAVVALCRSLCFATSKMVRVLDDQLSDVEADTLTDDELFPVAMSVVRSYATAAARDAEDPKHQRRNRLVASDDDGRTQI